MGVFWAMLLWIFHTEKKKRKANVSLQNVNGVQSQRERAEGPLWYTWSRLHTWGWSSPQSQKALVMCCALCDRGGQNCKLITQRYQSSSLNALDSLLSVFLDGWESSSCTSKCEGFFPHCLAWGLNLSSFYVLKGLGEAAILGQQRMPCKAAQNLSCFNRCCFMFCQRMAPFISVMNAVFLSVSKCFSVLNLILIYHSFWLIGCPFAFGASIAFTMKIWICKEMETSRPPLCTPADFLVGWRGCISRSDLLSQVIPNVRKNAEVEMNNSTL